ncbi:DUF998 domain-containing protein [Plantactinospora sp. GCM10030261]|uniref:DUF998 domain-containing protein n=1 Tax=Plantactinospora sp. GCM10030261 TaxID=3273420 RepID=UPI00360CC343
MTQQTATAGTAATRAGRAGPAATGSLLGYGVIAGPTYVLVSLTEAALRDGFDPTRHPWSLLANGAWGWIHMANLMLFGVLVLAFAAGLRRALRTGRGAIWAPRLFAGYGVGLVLAGIFRADPGAGFPPGTPEVTPVSWHGMLHFVAGGVGFLAMVVGCLLLARRFAAERRTGWAVFTAVTAVFFLVAFVGIGAGAGSGPTILAFTAAVLLSSAWLSAVAVHIRRTEVR